jgi:hypothetical protein
MTFGVTCDDTAAIVGVKIPRLPARKAGMASAAIHLAPLAVFDEDYSASTRSNWDRPQPYIERDNIEARVADDPNLTMVGRGWKRRKAYYVGEVREPSWWLVVASWR